MNSYEDKLAHYEVLISIISGKEQIRHKVQ
jgi:hypothetical protein